MLLIVTTLFTTFAINASAATAEEFISEVALVYEDSVEAAKKAIEGTDWKLYEQGFIDRNGDKYLLLIISFCVVYMVTNAL